MTLGEFNFAFQPSVERRQIETEVAEATGPPGADVKSS
jgi:hypothetical protein